MTSKHADHPDAPEADPHGDFEELLDAAGYGPVRSAYDGATDAHGNPLIRTGATSRFLKARLPTVSSSSPRRRARGDQQGAAELCEILERHRRLAYDYALSRLADPPLAELLTAKALTNVLAHLAQTDIEGGNVSALLLAATRRVINQWQDGARRDHAMPSTAVEKLLDQALARHAARYGQNVPKPATAERDAHRGAYPDPQHSRAALIAVSHSATAPALPAAERSAQALARCLHDSGIPDSTVLHGGDATRANILREVTRALEAADTSVIHIAAHGYADPAGRLTLDTADGDGAHSGLTADELLDRVRDARAKRTLVILDACASGLAAQSAQPGAEDREIYYMTASVGAESALASDPARSGDPYTPFTGALIDALTVGVPGPQPDLDVPTLYWAVDRALARTHLPRPTLTANGAVDKPLALGRNPRFRDESNAEREARALLTSAAADDSKARDALISLLSRIIWTTARSLRLDPDSCDEISATVWKEFASRDADLDHPGGIVGWTADRTRHWAFEQQKHEAMGRMYFRFARRWPPARPSGCSLHDPGCTLDCDDAPAPARDV